MGARVLSAQCAPPLQIWCTHAPGTCCCSCLEKRTTVPERVSHSSCNQKKTPCLYLDILFKLVTIHQIVILHTNTILEQTKQTPKKAHTVSSTNLLQNARESPWRLGSITRRRCNRSRCAHRFATFLGLLKRRHPLPLQCLIVSPKVPRTIFGDDLNTMILWCLCQSLKCFATPPCYLLLQHSHIANREQLFCLDKSQRLPQILLAVTRIVREAFVSNVSELPKTSKEKKTKKKTHTHTNKEKFVSPPLRRARHKTTPVA